MPLLLSPAAPSSRCPSYPPPAFWSGKKSVTWRAPPEGIVLFNTSCSREIYKLHFTTISIYHTCVTGSSPARELLSSPSSILVALDAVLPRLPDWLCARALEGAEGMWRLRSLWTFPRNVVFLSAIELMKSQKLREQIYRRYMNLSASAALTNFYCHLRCNWILNFRKLGNCLERRNCVWRLLEEHLLPLLSSREWF